MINNYSRFFLICLVFVLLYGISGIYIILQTDWSRVINPSDTFGYQIGLRILTTRLLAMIFFLALAVFVILTKKYMHQALIICAIWSWASFIDDSIALQVNIIIPSYTSGQLLLMARPLYLLAISWMLFEEIMLKKRY